MFNTKLLFVLKLLLRNTRCTVGAAPFKLFSVSVKVTILLYFISMQSANFHVLNIFNLCFFFLR